MAATGWSTMRLMRYESTLIRLRGQIESSSAADLRRALQELTGPPSASVETSRELIDLSRSGRANGVCLHAAQIPMTPPMA